MKQGLGFVLAAFVGLLGQASAHAQPASPAPAPTPAQPDPNAAPPATPNPNAPPPPPPAGEPSPTPDAPPPVTLPPYLTGNTTTPLMPPVPPPPPPATTQPGPSTPPPPVAGPGPGADTGTVPGRAPPRVRWRGTNLNWNNSFTTTALGVGRDNIGSEGEQVTTGLGLTLNYFLIEPKTPDGKPRGYSLRTALGIGFDTELTNSDFSKYKNEALMRDTSLSFVSGIPLWKSADEESAISSNLNMTFAFPTSKASYGEGIYLGVSPRASLFFQIPVLGHKSSVLDNILLGVSMRYDHRFSRANVATNPDMAETVVRQDLNGISRPNDVLSARFVDANSVRPSAFIFFDENILGGVLQVFLAGGLNYRFLQDPGNGGTGQDCENTVGNVLTGPACVNHADAAAPTYALNTAFSVGLTFFPMVEWGINLGYDNVAPNLNPKSEIQNPFYSAAAQFSGGIVLSLDAIYERFTGPPRDEPFIVFGRNQRSPTLTQTQQALFF